MAKINIGQNIFSPTMSVTLLGTTVNDKPNFMTLAWITRANSNPPLLQYLLTEFIKVPME